MRPLKKVEFIARDGGMSRDLALASALMALNDVQATDPSLLYFGDVFFVADADLVRIYSDAARIEFGMARQIYTIVDLDQVQASVDQRVDVDTSALRDRLDRVEQMLAMAGGNPPVTAAFATRADLLSRSNSMRLAQLATPTDVPMIPDSALRTAISGGGISQFSPEEQTGLLLALDRIDAALSDADSLMVSYGIPATVHTPILTRFACTLALYYLQGTEQMTDDVRRAYEGVLSSLTAHSTGKISLLPSVPDASVAAASGSSGSVVFSSPLRYGRGAATPGDEDDSGGGL